jgi:Domain of unknown function (DUF4440)
VFVGPDLTRVARGADAAASSYDAFVSSATILDASVGETQVDEFGALAVATLTWSITYIYEGTESTEHGHDLYVLRREGDDWKICWRQIVR